MKPITIRLINKNISDVYCYVGVVLFTTHDGDLYSLPLRTVYSNLAGRYKEFRGFLEIALVNNDWISNEQFSALIQNETKRAFERDWNRAASEIYEYLVDLGSCLHIGRSSGLPIYDIKAYAHHIFVAHGKGLDDFRISGDTKDGIRFLGSAKKFDGRSLSVSAKIGQVLVSSGKNGLFSGSIWDEDFSIDDEPIQSESFRTIWTNFDFNNYTGSATFRHYINLTREEEQRNFYYSKQDEERSKRRITKIGVETIESSDLIDEEQTKYVVNSNDLFFLFKKSGEVTMQRLKRGLVDTHLSSFTKTIIPTFRKQVLDVRTAKNGLVIETFDSLELLSNSKVTTLSKIAPLNFRTYLGSLRLRNMISATFPEYTEVYLHA